MSAWQFGSSMIIFAAGLKEIPGSYYEAAEIDGANKWRRFLRITLPCLSPIILYNLVMQTITAFMAFTQAFVITQGDLTMQPTSTRSMSTTTRSNGPIWVCQCNELAHAGFNQLNHIYSL